MPRRPPAADSPSGEWPCPARLAFCADSPCPPPCLPGTPRAVVPAALAGSPLLTYVNAGGAPNSFLTHPRPLLLLAALAVAALVCLLSFALGRSAARLLRLDAPAASSLTPRRRELLEAAYAYALRSGLGDLSLRPLAEAIGTSPRVLLYLFDSKDGLIRALLARARADELAHVQQLADPQDGPRGCRRPRANCGRGCPTTPTAGC
ncbi:TetR/AcrR family transcriptional regulator [Streptomyces griseoruber]|uniref:TetR/AcrR family transcriptional regulator n=1 Tax=Streptomyces griseoruber TaxID=1943 RepID=UPI00379B6CA5